MFCIESGYSGTSGGDVLLAFGVELVDRRRGSMIDSGVRRPRPRPAFGVIGPFVLAASLAVASCAGPPEGPVPGEPLLAYGDFAAGPRMLSDAQTGALRAVVTAAGHPCEAVERTYLQGIEWRNEIWNVRCAEDSYVIELSGDGADDGAPGPSRVRRCDGRFHEAPCFQPRARMRVRDSASPLPPAPALLMEELTPAEDPTR